MCIRDRTAPFTTQYTYLKGSNAGGETTLVAEIKNGGETLSYTYDQFGNIVSVSQNGTVVESYEYDGLNQLIKVTNGANVTEYAYDAGGNLTSVKLNGEVQDTYGYTDAGWKDLLTSFNGQAITYDEIGNPLAYRDGFAFTLSLIHIFVGSPNISNHRLGGRAEQLGVRNCFQPASIRRGGRRFRF